MSESRAEGSRSKYRLSASDGELLVHTKVAGRAARMGHRLTIAMTQWRASVSFDGPDPVAVDLVVDVDSLQVLSGEGGVTPLSGAEKALVRANALGCFEVRSYPQIRFRTDTVDPAPTGYRLAGAVEIHGVTRPHTADVVVDGTRVSCATTVRQKDFGIKHYSMLMGSLKVVDEVDVSFIATIPSP